MKPSRPKTLREQMADSNRALNFHARMAGLLPVHHQTALPEIKRRGPNKPHDDTEAPVVKAVGELLGSHPNVLWAARINGGSAMIDDGKGGARPLWFYRFVRMTEEEITLTDFILQLKDGRFGVIECKKPSWTKPTTPREQKQLSMILTVKYAGGIAGFVTGVDDAQRLLEGK